jgi:PadR family transcriptional regulator PadR
MPKGMKVGAVSLWLLLLLSERPMYGYEIIRELEKKFSGYWKPKTGTIYPALEKLETNGFVTSHVDFKGEVPDRKHYALTTAGEAELANSMAYWTKMTEVLENYREVHESIARHRSSMDAKEVARILRELSDSLEKKGGIVLARLFPVEKPITVNPTEPLKFKFLYAKEDQKLEIHMEIEWLPLKDGKDKAPAER